MSPYCQMAGTVPQNFRMDYSMVKLCQYPEIPQVQESIQNIKGHHHDDPTFFASLLVIFVFFSYLSFAFPSAHPPHYAHPPHESSTNSPYLE